jgi:anti-sigma factor RsiW
MRTQHVTDRKISRLLDGELSSAEHEAVCLHLDQCQVCREKVVHWQRIDQYLRHDERKIASPSFFEQKILAHVHREVATAAGYMATGGNRRPYLYGLKFRFATAGLVALGIFLGTVMGTKLTAFLAREKEDIDIIAVLSSQDISSPSIIELGLDFINGNGGESS